MDWCTYATIVLSILVTYFIDLWTGEPMRQLFYQYYPHTLWFYGLVYLCYNCFINILVTYFIISHLWTGVPMRQLFCQY